MIIKTYQELQFYVEMFRNNNIDLLILEGIGGLSKSRIVEEVMKDKEYLKIVSHVSPMKLYMLGYEHQNKPIIIDDIDTLLQNDSNVSLLKMFCDTSETKEINWYTTSEILEKEGVPSRYETKSKVVIITNSFKEVTEKISALKDRGWLLEFKPSKQEVLDKMKSLIPLIDKELSLEEKEEVYNIIEKYSSVIETLSIRTLVKGIALYKECKGRVIDWKSLFLSSLELNSKLVLLDKILRDYLVESERINAWENAGYSRRNYYEYKLKLGADVRSSVKDTNTDLYLENGSSLAQGHNSF